MVKFELALGLLRLFLKRKGIAGLVGRCPSSSDMSHLQSLWAFRRTLIPFGHFLTLGFLRCED